MKSIYLFGLPVVMTLAGCASTISKITTACNHNLPIVQALAPVAPAIPYGSAIVAGIEGGCTAAGILQMAENDKLPVTPSNSGDSAGYVATSTLQLAKAIAAAK